MEDLFVYVDQLKEVVIIYGLQLVLAVVFLIVGWWGIRRLIDLIEKLMVKRGVDESLQPFLLSIISIAFKVVLILSVISQLGVPTASFLAVLGSAGLAIGLALQGSLSNFAGGVLILTVKPFRKGDFIQAMGVSGSVHLIHLLNTVLKTADGQLVFIPNGQLAGATITNFSAEPTRRLVINFGISYGDDIAKAKAIIQQEIEADPRVLKDPEPSIVVNALGDNAVNIAMRVWTATGDYWALNFELHEKVKNHFDRENITIPFPQRDIHVYNHQVSRQEVLK